jgi:hypothetical protein
MMTRYYRSASGPLALISLAFVLAVLFGCAGFQKRVDGLFGDSATDIRDEAAVKYNYKGVRDEVFVEPPTISPNIVSAGDTIIQTTQFAVLSPDKYKKFKVTEIVTLSGKDILLELSRKDSERPQGAQVSTVTFTVPSGLARGIYRLIATISIPGMERKQTGNFRVK